MAEHSYPIEEHALTSAEWSSVTLGIGDGILDEGGQPYRMYDIDNVENGAKIGVDRNTGKASAILRGFYHLMDSYEIVRLPAVSAPTTYYVGLQYDPLRTAQPVKLGVWTSLDYSSGKFYLINYTVQRQPNQLLTDATITNTTRKLAPSFTVDTFAALPAPERVLWGTVAVVTPNNRSIRWYQARRASNSDETMQWVLVGDMAPSPVTIPYPATRVHPGHGNRLSVLREGRKRTLFGRVAIESGASFTPVASGAAPWWLFNLPAEDRPAATFASSAGAVSSWSDTGFARVECNADGQVLVGPSKTTAWIGVDGITYYVN